MVKEGGILPFILEKICKKQPRFRKTDHIMGREYIDNQEMPDKGTMENQLQMETVAQLFAENHQAVRRYIFGLCRGKDEANDVAQETYLTVLRKASQFKPGTRFLSWVFQIARFKSLEQHRANTKSATTLAPETLEALANEAEENPFFDTEELQTARVNALKECRGVLTGRNQEFLRLRYEQGLKPAKIAETFGLKPESIHVALSKSRTFLKQCMEAKLKNLSQDTQNPKP